MDPLSNEHLAKTFYEKCFKRVYANDNGDNGED